MFPLLPLAVWLLCDPRPDLPALGLAYDLGHTHYTARVEREFAELYLDWLKWARPWRHGIDPELYDTWEYQQQRIVRQWSLLVDALDPDLMSELARERLLELRLMQTDYRMPLPSPRCWPRPVVTMAYVCE